MQIKKIILYNKNNEHPPRVLPFELGKLNIISGESKTGKSALVGIIDYCLGSNSCNIYDGIIRDTVSFFSIIISFEDEDIFIARLNPDIKGKKTINELFFKRNLVEEEIPEFSEIIPNSNNSSLKTFLSEKLNIEENLQVPETHTRDPLEANFKHSRIFCFQPQYLIAQPNQLFYHQDDTFTKIAIKDTFPYFLGAINSDSLQIEREITKKKRTLNQLTRIKREEAKLKEEGISKAYSLIEEGKEIGILESNTNPKNIKEAFELLGTIRNWEYEPVNFKGDDSGLKELIENRNIIKAQLGNIEDDINAVTNYIQTAKNYTGEIRQQELRLESIGFFSDNGNINSDTCPLCSSHLEISIPTIEDINNSLLEIKNDLNNTSQESPRVKNYLDKLDENQITLQGELERIERGITSLYQQKEKARNLRDLNIRRGRVIGRVSLFLENIEENVESSNLDLKIKNLENDIEELSKKVDNESTEEKLNSILSRINLQMTEWSNLIDVEYKGYPIRFDLKNLDLIVDTEEKPIALSTGIGSGANWLSYHLLLFLALHKHFVKNNRPVPRFLLIDQPTQVYYPPESNPEIVELGSNLSSDAKAVKDMFNFLIEVVNQLNPHFQVIVMDHALLNDEAFNESIVEIWRKGQKLIPEEWID